MSRKEISALLVVESDPRESGRPAEAVRIAAGISSWGHVHVGIYFHGAAVLCLREFVGELRDGDQFRQCLPILQEHGCPLFCDARAGELSELHDSPWTFRRASTTDLSRQSRESDCLLRF